MQQSLERLDKITLRDDVRKIAKNLLQKIFSECNEIDPPEDIYIDYHGILTMSWGGENEIYCSIKVETERPYYAELTIDDCVFTEKVDKWEYDISNPIMAGGKIDHAAKEIVKLLKRE
jgi:hypothetical protein